MKKLLNLTAGVFFMAAGSASAADVDAPPPPLRGYYDWTGVYAGVFGFYTSGTADASIVSGGSGSDSFTIDGAQFGGLAGYNFQDSWIVYGVESDLGFNDVDGTSALGPINDFDVSPTWHLRGRVGFAMDNVLPFFAAGLSTGDGDARVAGFGAPSVIHLGWNVGFGVDWGITDNIIVRAEYIYDDFSTGTYKYAPGNIDIKWTSNTARAAVMFKF